MAWQGNPIIDDENSEDYRQFKQTLDFINISLAKMIARMGKGLLA